MSEEPRLLMPVYTNVFKIQRDLYQIGDSNLPLPVPMWPAGVACGVGLVIFFLTSRLFHLDFTLSLIVSVIVGWVAAWLTNRAEIEGRAAHWFLLSMAAYPFVIRGRVDEEEFRFSPRRLRR